MPRYLIAATCAALALAFSACGDDDKSDDSATTTPPPAAQTSTPSGSTDTSGEVKVGMKDIKFVPEDITVKVGQKIVWTNDDAVVHNVTATDGATFESDSLSQGDTFDYTPTKAGKIAYVCTIHQGQNGTITVTK